MEHPDVTPDPAREVRAHWAAGRREEAYSMAVETTQDSLYRYLVSMLRDQEAARDVFQDTYLRVFRSLGGFRGDSSLTTWVLRIGRNLALNRLRAAKLRGAREVPLAVEMDPPDPGRGPGDPPGRALVEALDALPSIQREAVVLYYVEDFTVAEVAEATGRPANTVKSDLLRARKTLRAVLERFPGPPSARPESEATS